MTSQSPILVWIRRDLRLQDHAALWHAAQSGRPVVPVVICDTQMQGLGAAAKWRYARGLGAFGRQLAAQGSRLTLRRGDPEQVLTTLADELGAGAVYWQRCYDPTTVARDTALKQSLQRHRLEVRSFAGQVLFDPWAVTTKTGGPYKVFTPYWRAVRQRPVAAPLAAPKALPAPAQWPASEALEEWNLTDEMSRGARILDRYTQAGEAAALAQLDTFIATGLAEYGTARDILSVAGCSGLSAALTYGEISPATVWHRVWAAGEQGNRGADAFLRQLVWRDFAWHLYWHHPDLGSQEWRPDWQSFDWGREVTPEVLAWQQGRTGIEVVDAGMRELYTTGYMHNRVRMIAASYLTKHLRSDWRIGLRWFEDCLVDWDPASNAMGWQWVAGCGPDAAPYFRVFNPDTQADKFDRDHSYRRRWIAEGQAAPPQTALDFYEAIPRRWALASDDIYPAPVVDLSEGRKAALSAYENWKSAKAEP